MNKYDIKIDYLSATFPLVVNDNESKQLKIDEMVYLIAGFMKIPNCEVKKDKYAHNYFNYEYTLSNDIKLRLDGPKDKNYQNTCQLELKGDGCRKFEELNPDISWKEFILFLQSLKAVFKRIDIAIDDYSGGMVNLSWLYEKLNKKHYTSVFRGSFHPYGNLDSGIMTIQLGTKHSATQLVIYDKKKEREDRKKPCDKEYWVRFEIRFRKGMAQDIVDAFLKQDDLQVFALSHLYRILDIKEDNNYSERHQNNVSTDKDWLLFLNNQDKAELLKANAVKVPTWSAYEKYAAPYVSSLLILLWILCNHDDRRFTACYYTLLANNLNFSKPRLKRLNQYLKEQHINVAATPELLEELKKECLKRANSYLLPGESLEEYHPFISGSQ